LFNWGGNIYVIGYEKNGRTMYTLIDSGERRYKSTILKLLKDNGIEPANIERILLTHHHFDHSGLLDVLCMVSGARVLVHPDFKGDSIELDLSRFGKYIEWLPAARKDRVRNIGGIPFSILGEPLDIGEGAKLEILGLPEGDQLTHTVDQLLFMYTPKNSPETLEKIGAGFRPTDEILFSGDLWLIHPPGFFDDTMRGMIIAELVKERRRRFDFRPQNRREKDALKVGFSIITVKPGHGTEFLGSRIMGTLLARRDLMVKLGFDENDKKNALEDPKFAPRVKQLQENAYHNFIEELKLWLKPLDKNGFGYTTDDVADFLLRIYNEQSGGGELVGQDRSERRIDLKQKLATLKTDREQPAELHAVAGAALALIEKVA
jgi:glyoxylase-like metal-dependent hydrolase (beta-lactamase superfamily II)